MPESFDFTEYTTKSPRFSLSPTLWGDVDYINNFFGNIDIQSIKYFNEDCSAINDQIKMLPNNKGGIYFFILKHPVIPGISSHIMYIGRARITKHQNLRKRCREYFSNYYKKNTNRNHIRQMLENWDDHLYLNFIELDNNEIIDNIEKKLINSFLPPYNRAIPSAKIKAVKQALPAF